MMRVALLDGASPECVRSLRKLAKSGETFQWLGRSHWVLQEHYDETAFD